LLLLIARLRHRRRYYHLALGIHCRLTPLTLHIPLPGTIPHDPGLRVGQVPLGKTRRHIPRASSSAHALPPLIRLSPCLILLRTHGRTDPHHPRPLQPMLRGQLIAALTSTLAHILPRIHSFPLPKQPLHLTRPLTLIPLHPPAAHPHDIANTRPYPPPLQPHISQLNRSPPPAHPQHSYTHPGRSRILSPPELGKPLPLNTSTSRHHPERHPNLPLTHHLARPRHAAGAGIEQEPHQHPTVVSRLTPAPPLTTPHHSRQVQLIHHLAHQVGKPNLGPPLIHHLRQHHNLPRKTDSETTLTPHIRQTPTDSDLEQRSPPGS
jgi:hypothetical protein